MEREKIDIKDKWDLSTIYDNHDTFYQDLEKAKSLINDLVSYKGKICSSIDSFYNFLSTKDTVERLVSNYDGFYNWCFRSFFDSNIFY